MSKRIYLAGKVSGVSLIVATQKFGSREKELRDKGFEVVNPLSVVDWHDTWFVAMKKCIPALLQCDEVHMLPCWKDSVGATLEHDIAVRLGMRVVYLE